MLMKVAKDSAQKGEYHKAIQCFTRVLAFAPYTGDAYLGRARLNSKVGLENEAGARVKSCGNDLSASSLV
jgi:hypothetical protein